MHPAKILIKVGPFPFHNADVLNEFAFAMKQYLEFDYQVAVLHSGGREISDHFLASLRDRGLRATTVFPKEPAEIPVMAADEVLCGDGRKIDPDWKACALAASLRARYLVFLTDQKGILDPAGAVYQRLSRASLKELLVSRTVSGGMALKVRSILQAFERGVREVRIVQAESVRQALWSDKVGTWCLPEIENEQDIDAAESLRIVS